MGAGAGVGPAGLSPPGARAAPALTPAHEQQVAGAPGPRSGTVDCVDTVGTTTRVTLVAEGVATPR